MVWIFKGAAVSGSGVTADDAVVEEATFTGDCQMMRPLKWWGVGYDIRDCIDVKPRRNRRIVEPTGQLAYPARIVGEHCVMVESTWFT